MEKRSILYSTARVAESRIWQKAMGKIDAVGPVAMFGDEDFERVLILYCVFVMNAMY